MGMGAQNKGLGLLVLMGICSMLFMGCQCTRLDEVRLSREISGLALFSERSASCVHDAKADIEAKDPRLGVIDSSVKGGRYRSINVAWPNGELASDLEAIGRVPGREQEFLLAESGYSTNHLGEWSRAGRLFRIECVANGNEVRQKSCKHGLADGNEGYRGNSLRGDRRSSGVVCGESEWNTLYSASGVGDAARLGNSIHAHECC